MQTGQLQRCEGLIVVVVVVEGLRSEK